MDLSKVNLGGPNYNMKVFGVDEALEKINTLTQKIAEANVLIEELNSAKVEITITGSVEGPQVGG